MVIGNMSSSAVADEPV